MTSLPPTIAAVLLLGLLPVTEDSAAVDSAPVDSAAVDSAAVDSAVTNDDAVNERPPIRADQLEAHWQVDCSQSWQRLATAVEDFRATARCQFAPALRRQLQLCAFIHQPPGPGPFPTPVCRDFQAALEQLDPGIGSTPCAGWTSLVAAARSCDNAAGGNGLIR